VPLVAHPCLLVVSPVVCCLCSCLFSAESPIAVCGVLWVPWVYYMYVCVYVYVSYIHVYYLHDENPHPTPPPLSDAHSPNFDLLLWRSMTIKSSIDLMVVGSLGCSSRSGDLALAGPACWRAGDSTARKGTVLSFFFTAREPELQTCPCPVTQAAALRQYFTQCTMLRATSPTQLQKTTPA
jgi:hypothetical protein